MLSNPIQGFWYFARSRSRQIQVNPRNPAKFTKTRKIPQNLVKILSNRCLYNIFETYFNYWGYLLAVNLQIYLETLSLKCANNVPKLPVVDYVAKNWVLAMMLNITTSRRFKCVPQILGLSSIHIFRLLFLPLSITFRRIHERNSFDLGAICLFCFEFCCLIDFLIPFVTWWVLNLSIKILGLAC